MMRKLTWKALLVVVVTCAVPIAAMKILQPDRSAAGATDDVPPLTDDVSATTPDAKGEASSAAAGRLNSWLIENWVNEAHGIDVQFSDRKIQFPIVQDVHVAHIAETLLATSHDLPDSRIFVDAKKSLVVAVDSQQAEQVVQTITRVLFEEPGQRPEVTNNPDAVIHRADGKRGQFVIGHGDVQTLVERGNSISVKLGLYNIHVELPENIDRVRLAKRIVALQENAPKIRFQDLRDYLVIATPVADVVCVAGTIAHELAYSDPDELDAESTEPEDDELPVGLTADGKPEIPPRRVAIFDAAIGADAALDEVLERANRIVVLFNDRKVGFPIVRDIPIARIIETIQSTTRDKKLGARLSANGKELIMRVDSQQAARVVRIITRVLFEELAGPNELTNLADTLQTPDGKRRMRSELIVGPDGVRMLVERGNRIAVSLGVYNINFWLPERFHRARLANRIISLNEKDPTIRFMDGRNHLWLETTTADVVRVVNAITRELAHFDSDEFENESSTTNKNDSRAHVRKLPSKPAAAPDSPDETDPFSDSVSPPASAETLAELQERYAAREKEAAEIGRMIMNTSAPSERESLRRKLRRVVAKSFALRQQLHQAELAAFQVRMARTQGLLEARERIKDQIIDRRVDDLVNPRLKWEPATAGSGPVRPVSPAETRVVSDGDENPPRPTAAKTPRDDETGVMRQSAMTPREVVDHADKLLERQSIVVRFCVASVDTVMVTMPNVESFQLYRLLPDVNVAPALDDRFCVVLEYGMEIALKNLGIKDLKTYFTNKTIEVQGRLSELRSPSDPTESLRQYNINIADLDQLRIVTAAGGAATGLSSSPVGESTSPKTLTPSNPREQARQILKQVLEQGTQPMMTGGIDDRYPYEGSTGIRNSRFLPDYVGYLNEYLEDHRADYGTLPYLWAVQSLDNVLRSWHVGDQWPLQKTAGLLAAAVADDLTSPDRADRDDPLAVETQCVVLRQLARLRVQIPDAVAASIPRSQKTRDKLALLDDMLSHCANDRWVSQEQVRLAGLLDEAPVQTIRAIMRADSDKDSASIEKWLYAVSSPVAYDAYRTSPQTNVRPPVDPILMLAILRQLAGESQHTDARIARVFANPHPSLLFPRHIDDVLSGRWAFREMAHNALLEMAKKTECLELRTQIEKLDPRVAAERE